MGGLCMAEIVSGYDIREPPETFGLPVKQLIQRQVESFCFIDLRQSDNIG
jgi:hypothetical protein